MIATASPSHNSYLRSLGADEVLDYNTVRFEDKVRSVDVVLNTVELASQGKFQIHIDQQLPLAEAAKAWEMNRKGHTAGKIILIVSR